MNYYDLIKEYGKGKSEPVMWAVTKRVSDFLEPFENSHPREYWGLIKDTYSLMCGPHYNECFASWQIEQMYYKDKAGTTHQSPHWTKAQYKEAFELIRPKLKSANYNCWDVAVTLEMLYSDNICMYRSWWPGATEKELETKVAEAAINYLNDDDDSEGKIWHRFHKE